MMPHPKRTSAMVLSVLIFSTASLVAAEALDFKLTGASRAGEAWKAMSAAGPAMTLGTHRAVWTGREMIVWGSSPDAGGRYDPLTDTWTTMNLTAALLLRQGHSATWTGSEVIAYGGIKPTPNGSHAQGDGARYNPLTDSWLPLMPSGAPSARLDHSAIWTGSELLIFGGSASLGNQGPLSSLYHYAPNWLRLGFEFASPTNGGYRLVTADNVAAASWQPATPVFPHAAPVTQLNVEFPEAAAGFFRLQLTP